MKNTLWISKEREIKAGTNRSSIQKIKHAEDKIRFKGIGVLRGMDAPNLNQRN